MQLRGQRGVGRQFDNHLTTSAAGRVTTLGGDVGVFAPGKGFRSIQFVDNDPDARNPKLVKGLFDLEVDNGIIHGINRVLLP